MILVSRIPRSITIYFCCSGMPQVWLVSLIYPINSRASLSKAGWTFSSATKLPEISARTALIMSRPQRVVAWEHPVFQHLWKGHCQQAFRLESFDMAQNCHANRCLRPQVLVLHGWNSTGELLETLACHNRLRIGGHWSIFSTSASKGGLLNDQHQSSSWSLDSP